MTKSEMLKSPPPDAKFSHRWFSNKEWIRFEGSNIYDEKGYLLHNFWQFRTCKSWERGWQKIN